MRASKYHGAWIYRNRKENPRRVGCKGYNSWNLIYDGMIYAEYIAAGGRQQDLKWDEDHGYVRLVYPGDPGTYEALKEENARLRSEIKGKEKASPEMEKILVIFFEAGGRKFSSDHIATEMRMKHKEKARYYFDKLEELEFIKWANNKPAGEDHPNKTMDLYALTVTGRAYVVEQGLVE